MVMRSLGDVLDGNKGIGPGFDTLRLTLSILVICWHSMLVSYGSDLFAWQSPLGHLGGALLPMFFALSGFLVMGSALRVNDLRKFISLRILRIVPALATEIALSALVLGTIFTTLPLWDFVTDRQFIAYFGSLIGRIRVSLPGVFETNPYPEVVNISLWTITPELLCYVLISVLILLAVYRHKVMMTVVVALLTLLCVAFDSETFYIGRPSSQALVLSFAYGNLLYLWKDSIPYNGIVFAACLALGFAFVRVVGVSYGAMFCLSYCIVFLGLTRLPRIPVLDRGDYSYGIYLYGFPIQQLVCHLLPGFREWYWNIAFALPIAIVVAMFSWTFIEKPALDLRKRLVWDTAASSDSWSYATKAALLFALLAYALFLMWYAGLVPEAPFTAWLALKVVAGLVLVSAATIAVMAALDRKHSWPAVPLKVSARDREYR